MGRSRTTNSILLAMTSAIFAVTASAASAAEPAANEKTAVAYVAIDALPLFDGENLTDRRLRRGDAVKRVLDAPPPANLPPNFTIPVEPFVSIYVGEGERSFTMRVPRWTLSDVKVEARPAAAPVTPPQPAAGDPLQPFQGTWVLVGVSILGKMNPELGEFVPSAPFERSARREMSGMPGPKLPTVKMLVPGAKNVQTSASMGMPKFQYFHVANQTVTAWSYQQSTDAEGRTRLEPAEIMEFTLKANAAKAPVVFDLTEPGPFARICPAIVERRNDVLCLAMMPSILGVRGDNIKPAQADIDRPKSFTPTALKTAVVCYLMPVGETEHPLPTGPRTNSQGPNSGGGVF